MRSAQIENGVVVNVIVGELDGYIICPDEVGTGWLYDGNDFSPPAVPTPTLAEAKAAVIGAIRGRMRICIIDGVIWKYNGGDDDHPVRLTSGMKDFLAFTQAAITHPTSARPDAHGGKIYQDGAEFEINDNGFIELALFAVSWGLRINRISLNLVAAVDALTLQQLTGYDAGAINWTVAWSQADQNKGWSGNIVTQLP